MSQFQKHINTLLVELKDRSICKYFDKAEVELHEVLFSCIDLLELANSGKKRPCRHNNFVFN